MSLFLSFFLSKFFCIRESGRLAELIKVIPINDTNVVNSRTVGAIFKFYIIMLF